jgi:hypothetical protein
MPSLFDPINFGALRSRCYTDYPVLDTATA